MRAPRSATARRRRTPPPGWTTGTRCLGRTAPDRARERSPRAVPQCHGSTALPSDALRPSPPDRPAGYYHGVASPLVDIVRSVAPTCEISDELEPLLADRLARAAAAWPGAMVDPGRFVGAIAERLTADRPAVHSVEAMQTDDLYLACGCADGDPAALAAFEAHCGVA